MRDVNLNLSLDVSVTSHGDAVLPKADTPIFHHAMWLLYYQDIMSYTCGLW